MVKVFLRDASATRVPAERTDLRAVACRIEVLTKRGVRASAGEAAANPRARSATLRAAAKRAPAPRTNGGWPS
jgi:16S rRNA C1402 N4-methylase RsmH